MKKNYSELLKDPRWQKKRLEILNRDEFTCQDCGDKTTSLHVHHNEYIYGNDPWDYEDSNFKTVCHNCHTKIHSQPLPEGVVLSREETLILFEDKYPELIKIVRDIDKVGLLVKIETDSDKLMELISIKKHLVDLRTIEVKKHKLGAILPF